jgi:SAM-dependent methyltransferase
MSTDEQYADGTYLAKHPLWHAERSPWKAAHVLQGLAAANLAPTTLCDIGCGTGLALAQVARSLPSVTKAVGFEPSSTAPIHDDTIGVVAVRREDATQSTDRFDVAIMLDVFEHVPDYLGFLRSCRGLADHVVFHIPLEISAFTVIGGHLGNSRATLGHLHQFTRRTALDVLVETGYSPVHWHYTKAGWEGPGKQPRTAVNLVRRAAACCGLSFAERMTGGLSLLVVARTEGRG